MKKKAMIALTLAVHLYWEAVVLREVLRRVRNLRKPGRIRKRQREESAGGGEAAEGTAGGEKRSLAYRL